MTAMILFCGSLSSADKKIDVVFVSPPLEDI